MKAVQQAISRSETTTVRRPVQVKEKGLDAQLNHLARQLGVTLKELAPLLQLSESTLHRLRRQTTLTGSTAERVELLWAVIQHGLRV